MSGFLGIRPFSIQVAYTLGIHNIPLRLQSSAEFLFSLANRFGLVYEERREQKVLHWYAKPEALK